MTQTVRPPGEPIGDCPVCADPYYDYEEHSSCMGFSANPDLDEDDYCSRAGQSYYVTEYYIHRPPQ